jgi:cytochrome c553
MRQDVKIGILLLICLCTVVAARVSQAAVGQLFDATSGADHAHNFSSGANNDGPRALSGGSENSAEICVFCHTPHGASAESTLWNRFDPVGPNGDGTFPLYGSSTSNLQDTDGLQAAAKYYNDGTLGVVYPNGASRLCLSCHDGVSAIGGVLNGGVPGDGITMESGDETITSFYGSGSPLIIDLTVSHPISFVYDNTVINFLIDGRKLQGDVYLAANQSITPLDAQSRMQCTTCHDPHFDSRLANSGYLPFWRYGTGNPATDYDPVCHSCHDSSAGTEWRDLTPGNYPHEIPNP